MARPAPPQRRRPGRPAGVTQTPAERRELLLSAAERAIVEHGPDVSMEVMAATAGVSKPTLYDNFDGKAGLTSALIDRFSLRLLDAIAEQFVRPLTAEEVVRVGLAALLQQIDMHPAGYRYLISHATPDELLNEVGATLSIVLAALLEEQGLDSTIAPILTTAALAGLLTAAERWARTGTPGRDLVHRALADFVWGGMVGAGIRPSQNPIDVSIMLAAIAESPARRTG